MRERCKSAVPTADRSNNGEQRMRPKSSLGSAITRTPSASKSVGTTTPTITTATATAMMTTTVRPKSSKKSEKKFSDPPALPKKKTTTMTTTTNGNKHRGVPIMPSTDLDDADDNGIRLVDDEELDDEGKWRSIEPTPYS